MDGRGKRQGLRAAGGPDELESDATADATQDRATITADPGVHPALPTTPTPPSTADHTEERSDLARFADGSMTIEQYIARAAARHHPPDDPDGPTVVVGRTRR